LVHYSIDTDPRPKVHFWLATLSLLVSLAIPALVQSITQRVIVPSAFALYGGLIVLYDRYLWRIRPFSYAAAVPNIGGKYEGTVEILGTMGEAARELPVRAVVTQTWSKIEVVVESERTLSNVVMCGFLVDNPQRPHLVFTYLVRERVPHGTENRFGEGTQELQIEQGDAILLTGAFYSTKRHRGSMRLRRD
jgi:hypothetical protein